MIGFNYALIKLKGRSPTQHFPKLLKYYGTGDLPQLNKAILFGYSFQRRMGEHQNQFDGAMITGRSGRILKAANSQFEHDIHSPYGQGGSPFFLLSTKNVGDEQDYLLVGIHLGHFSGGKHNIGVLVSESMVERLKRWKSELTRENVGENKQNCFNICETRHRKIVSIEKRNQRTNRKPIPDQNPVKNVEASAIPLQSYKRFRFEFDTRTPQSQLYKVFLSEGSKTVQRQFDLPAFSNMSFHFISLEPFPLSKWKISLRVRQYSEDELIVLGFVNGFLKAEQQYSGLIGQRHCVSLCLCEESREMRRQGSMLIDGNLWLRSGDIFLDRGEVLTIYADVTERKLYWSFGDRGTIVESLIPESIFMDMGRMHFFVGLNNTQEVIEILEE